ncbi:MAG: serine hydrolase domain-containing protein, partial [Trueperaceae bacterium]
MARAIRCAVALAVLAALAVGVAQPDPAAVADAVDAEASRALDAHDVAGAAVAVIVGNEIVHLAGYGVADAASDRAVTTDTAFTLGSVTKMLTWTALMRLVQEGAVELDTPVSRYVDV